VRLLPVLLAAICFPLAGCGQESPDRQSQKSSGQRPPKTFTISEGKTTFKPGVARVGDTIICETSAGHGMGARVPTPGTGMAGFGDGPDGGASIMVSSEEDGSVVASCDGN
jgi:hypothetical protein